MRIFREVAAASVLASRRWAFVFLHWRSACAATSTTGEPHPAPAVGAAYWRVQDLLYAARDILLFPDMTAAHPTETGTLEEAAGIAADIALGLGHDGSANARFRGPGSYVPIDAERSLGAGRAALDELRRTPAAERRTPARYATGWKKIRAAIESLRDITDPQDPQARVEPAPLTECLAIAADLVAEVAPE